MKISIITATYNSASTLRDTLDSILIQTNKDYEVIVVDGKSKDNTLDIVKEYEKKFDGRMRWISEPDRGIYDAMNKGIAMACGEVIGILNSDDFFTSDDVIETVAKEIKEVDAVYGDIHFVKPENLTKCVRYYSSNNFRPWRMRFGFMPAHPSFYARKEVFEKYGLYSLEYKIAADYDMMVRLFCKHKISYKYIKKDFVTMRTGGMSTNSFAHRLLLTKEDAMACRKHGLYSNVLLCSFKYITKIFEFL